MDAPVKPEHDGGLDGKALLFLDRRHSPTRPGIHAAALPAFWMSRMSRVTTERGIAGSSPSLEAKPGPGRSALEFVRRSV
jgi:hypothetical protein